MLVRRRKAPERMQPRVAPELEDRAVGLVEVAHLVPALVGVGHHAAQLVHLELAAVEPDALLAVERALAGDEHDPGHGGQQ